MVNVAIYFHMINAMKSSIFNRLQAIRDMRSSELNRWLDERIIDIRTIADDKEIRTLEMIRQQGEEDNQGNSAIISEARGILRTYLEHYDDFYEIFIVSPSTRNIIVSTDKERERRRPAHAFHYEGALNSLDLFIEDIHYSTTLNKACMAFSMPIYSQKTGNRVIGVLVARFNLEASLYKLLSNRVGMEKTGEIFIVNKDVIVLNELRWNENAPLNLKMATLSAVDASLGNEGISETSDYRGREALEAYTYIPRTRWGFVVKQDLDEVYAPINKLRKSMIAIFIITVCGVLLVAYRVSRSISDPIKRLYKGSEIIGGGNLDHKVGTDAKDEIGQLSRIFDQMIENLRHATASWEDLNREITERKHLEKMLLEIREHERRRIGHDLHDNLGQQLTGISFMTQGLENTLRKKSLPDAEDAARIRELAEISKVQVKSLSIGLSPMLDKDEYGLLTAMVDLATNSEKLFGISCAVICNNTARIYNASALIHLYRIAQEAITNAARHSRAKHIEISLSKENNNITMAVKDDGTGFVVPDRINSMGLEVMRYRANIINATLGINSEINKGTVITCIFPDERG